VRVHGAIAPGGSPIRILVVSDLHYALRQFDWILARAETYDAVAVVGDALDIASPVPLEAQIVAVRTTLTELGRRTRLLLCSGNHDLDSLNGSVSLMGFDEQAFRTETIQ
jgi:predicted phosphodiesterase